MNRGLWLRAPPRAAGATHLPGVTTGRRREAPYSGGSRYASSRPGWPLPLVATTMYCTPSST